MNPLLLQSLEFCKTEMTPDLQNMKTDGSNAVHGEGSSSCSQNNRNGIEKMALENMKELILSLFFFKWNENTWKRQKRIIMIIPKKFFIPEKEIC